MIVEAMSSASLRRGKREASFTPGFLLFARKVEINPRSHPTLFEFPRVNSIRKQPSAITSKWGPACAGVVVPNGVPNVP